VSVFWDKDGILLVDYLEKRAKYYVALLDKLKEQLVSKHRDKLSKGISFLQDSAAPHKLAITHQKSTDLHYEIQKHPDYPPDLAPSDYYLFPSPKKHLKGREFSTTEEATTLTADGWFAAQPNDFFLYWLDKSEEQSHSKYFFFPVP
jgi:histone-lysine N-methyltransferase SETMAR